MADIVKPYIVERLRERADALVYYRAPQDQINELREAADTIERLRAALLDRSRDDGTAAVGGEPGASAGKSE